MVGDDRGMTERPDRPSEGLRIVTVGPDGAPVAATADEEVGAGFGAQWLCEAHPDAVRCDYCINEGAGERLELGSGAFYLCSVAEKMSAPFRLRGTACRFPGRRSAFGLSPTPQGSRPPGWSGAHRTTVF